MVARSIYFDASVFIAWLNNEDARAISIGQVLAAAKDIELDILTSIITLTEVAYVRRDQDSLDLEETDQIINAILLDESLVSIVPYDQSVALQARRLVRRDPVSREGLQVLDAIHFASAEVAGADFFATYDRDFVHASDRVNIPIGPPTLEAIT